MFSIGPSRELDHSATGNDTFLAALDFDPWPFLGRSELTNRNGKVKTKQDGNPRRAMRAWLADEVFITYPQSEFKATHPIYHISYLINRELSCGSGSSVRWIQDDTVWLRQGHYQFSSWLYRLPERAKVYLLLVNSAYAISLRMSSC